MATAVIAATLTSVAVFLPMVFITGIAGQLFKDQSLTVTFALSLLAAGRADAGADAGRGPRARAAGDATPAVASKPLGRVARGAAHACAAVCDAPAAGSRAAAQLVLSPLVNVTQAVNHWAERKYPPAITWALAHPGKVIGSAVARCSC